MSNAIRKIESPAAPAPVGPYSQAIASGGLVFCAGQIPLDPETGKLVEGGIEVQAERVLENHRLARRWWRGRVRPGPDRMEQTCTLRAAVAAGAQRSGRVRGGECVGNPEESVPPLRVFRPPSPTRERVQLSPFGLLSETK